MLADNRERYSASAVAQDLDSGEMILWDEPFTQIKSVDPLHAHDIALICSGAITFLYTYHRCRDIII